MFLQKKDLIAFFFNKGAKSSHLMVIKAANILLKVILRITKADCLMLFSKHHRALLPVLPPDKDVK